MGVFTPTRALTHLLARSTHEPVHSCGAGSCGTIVCNAGTAMLECNDVGTTTFYQDTDGDGFGDPVSDWRLCRSCVHGSSSCWPGSLVCRAPCAHSPPLPFLLKIYPKFCLATFRLHCLPLPLQPLFSINITPDLLSRNIPSGRGDDRRMHRPGRPRGGQQRLRRHGRGH